MTRPGRQGILFAALVLLLAAGIAVYAFVLVPGERARALEYWRARLIARALDRQEIVAHWIEGRLGDTGIMARFPSVRAQAGAAEANAPSLDPGHLRPILTEFVTARGVEAVYLLAADGRVLVATEGAPARLPGAPHAGCTFARNERGEPRVLFASAVMDGERQVGRIVLVEDPAAWLYTRLRQETAPARTAETRLVSAADGAPRVLLAPAPRDPRARPLAPVPDGVGFDGAGAPVTFGRFTDAAGRAVLASAAPVRGSGWVVVASIRAREAMAASNAWLGALGAMLVAFFVAVAGVGAALARERRWAERQRAQAALALTKERLRLAQESAGIGLFDVDLTTGRIEQEGPRPPLLGDRAPTLSGWIEQAHPDDAARAGTALQLHMDGVAPRFECEIRVPGRVGGWRWVRIRGTVVQRGPSGAPLRMIGAYEDVTERLNLEADLRQAQKMEAVGGMAGGLAHDFNNLLTAIGGHTELALGSLADDAPARANLAEIARAAQRASGLTAQLLAFSRKQVLQPRVCDLNAIVAETQKMLSRLIGEHIAVETDLDPAAGRIKADPNQIVQVLMNLAVNARDAMPDGGTLRIRTSNVVVSAAQARERVGIAAGAHVALDVSDTGTGMTPEVQAHIFEPFFTTKDPGRGTGLGLSTVYGVVSQSGGSIWVEDSRPGAGTTFRVLLPRVAAPAERADDDPPHDAGGRGELVLLVEDEDLVRGFVERALADRGYRVVASAAPRDALALAERAAEPAALLLTDVVMPGMNGRELAQRLGNRWPGLRVLYMSGYTAGSVATLGILEPGLAFLQKPFRPEELGARVREVLDAPAGTYRH